MPEKKKSGLKKKSKKSVKTSKGARKPKSIPKPKTKPIYLTDHSDISKATKECYIKHLNNPTPNNDLESYKEYLLKVCNAIDYFVFFTSGEIESNILILCCSVSAYKKIRKIKPHIIISATEHDSLIKYAKSLQDSDQIELSILNPNSYGCILSETLSEAITPNTCLIMITFINQEMGSVNNIEKMSGIAHEHKIPIHSNCSHLFGRHCLDLTKNKIDSVSLSFDKIKGPVDIGALLINKQYFDGYRLDEHSTTLENKRKYNISNIAAAIECVKESLIDRVSKNKQLLQHRNNIINDITDKYQHITLENYMSSDNPPLTDVERINKVVILGPPIDNVLYYTPSILSFLLLHDDLYTADYIKKKLERYEIFIGNPDTQSNSLVFDKSNSLVFDKSKQLNVYDIIGIPKNVHPYIIRIVLNDELTESDITKFLDNLF